MVEQRTPAEDDDATVAMTAADGELRVGDVLKNRFELVEILGRGGMGQVFKAIDRIRIEADDPDHFVAIKVLGEAFRVHPNAGVAFEREAKKAMLLTHENICRVRDFDRDGNTRYMTMEYLSGRSLESIVTAEGFAGLSPDKAIALLAPVCDALDYAHQRRPPIVHYDLKPGNIFCTDKGTVKLIDFGIARAVKGGEAEQTMITEAVVPALSPRYASPEMLEGIDPDPRDDIYALGCVAHILFTGRHPFGIPATVARDQGMQPRHPDGLDTRAWAAICRALAFERSKRTPSAGEFLAELRGGRRARGRAGAIAAGLVGLAIAAAGGYLAGQHLGWFNTPPVAGADQVSTVQGGVVEVAALRNDVDTDGDRLRITEIVVPPRSGTAQIGDNGLIRYRPQASFVGEDRFLYTVEDGRGGRASAEVSITVYPPRVDPVFSDRPLPRAADDRIETTAGRARDVEPQIDDSHPGHESIALDRIVAPPRHGRATILGPRTIRYIPDPGYVGADAFTYGIVDPAGQRGSARIIVTVRPAAPDRPGPLAGNDTAITAIDTDVVIDVLANDRDPDGGRLAVVRVGRPQHGAVSINPDNTVVYTPAAGFEGTDAFRYTARSEAGTEAEAQVSVDVATANRPPEAGDLSATTPQDQPVTLDPLAAGVDPDGDPIVVTDVGEPASGTAVIVEDGRRITYSANPGFVGGDSFAFTISDDRGSTSTARARITVTPPGPDGAAIDRALADLPCALLKPEIADGVVTVRGLVGGKPPVGEWSGRLTGIAGVARVEWSTTAVGEEKCASLETLAPLVARNRDAPAGLSISTPRPAFREGENLTVLVRAPGYDAYVYIDYFTLDGYVVHLLPRRAAAANRLPARSLKSLGNGGLSGEWVVGPPFGTEMLSVVASPVPLFPTVRDEVEEADGYIAALRAAIARLGGHGAAGQPVVAEVAVTHTTAAR